MPLASILEEPPFSHLLPDGQSDCQVANDYYEKWDVERCNDMEEVESNEDVFIEHLKWGSLRTKQISSISCYCSSLPHFFLITQPLPLTHISSWVALIHVFIVNLNGSTEHTHRRRAHDCEAPCKCNKPINTIRASSIATQRRSETETVELKLPCLWVVYVMQHSMSIAIAATMFDQRWKGRAQRKLNTRHMTSPGNWIRFVSPEFRVRYLESRQSYKSSNFSRSHT